MSTTASAGAHDMRPGGLDPRGLGLGFSNGRPFLSGVPGGRPFPAVAMQPALLAQVGHLRDVVFP